jgi:hypothetical protein
VINDINQHRLKTHANIKVKEKEKVGPPVFNPKAKYIIDRGTRVRLFLTDPETVTGQKLPGKLRSADIKWRYNKTYVVKQYIIQPNSPVLYEIEDENGKPFNHLLTVEQLQVIKD